MIINNNKEAQTQFTWKDKQFYLNFTLDKAALFSSFGKGHLKTHKVSE